MEIKRADRGHAYGTVATNPVDQYVFIGEGPWYIFEHHDWFRFGLSDALNFFAVLERELNATVTSRTKSYVFDEDGERYYYEEIRVYLPAAPAPRPEGD